MVETADSFQGKQMDVIVLSCVRGSTATKPGVARSLGFLDDVRRINVAITRARCAALTISCSQHVCANRDRWWCGRFLCEARLIAVYQILASCGICFMRPEL